MFQLFDCDFFLTFVSCSCARHVSCMTFSLYSSMYSSFMTLFSKSSGVVVHEASRIEQQWKSFKESNAIANGLFNLRERYDESDNVVVRKARDVADSLSGVLSSLMESQDHSAVLTEIRRLDPTFDTLNFTVHLQHKVIPAVLEAFSDGDIETLRGWCTEACSIHLENVINVRLHHIAPKGMRFEARKRKRSQNELISTDTCVEEGVLRWLVVVETNGRRRKREREKVIIKKEKKMSNYGC
eukprot:m.259012 g.259012  ORF g.259012 m.259012 type:complete len:241 (+) comp15549_c1_seq14:879-1601(+)